MNIKQVNEHRQLLRDVEALIERVGELERLVAELDLKKANKMGRPRNADRNRS